MNKADWIYCKDRLPDPDHMDRTEHYSESKPCFVGILYDDGSKNIGVGTYIRFPDEEYWEGVTADDDDLFDLNVYAWLPFSKLPDPPLGDS